MNQSPSIAFDTEDIHFAWATGDDLAFLRTREWLVTNGLGGYAAGTLLGHASRRYHGLFIPHLSAPWGRTVLIQRLDDMVEGAGTGVLLSGGEASHEHFDRAGAECLTAFRLDGRIPTWTYSVGGDRLTKRIVMPHGQNTVYVEYTNEGRDLTLKLRPYVTFRGHDNAFQDKRSHPYTLTLRDDRFTISFFEEGPPLRLGLRPSPGVFAADPFNASAFYRIEKERGLDHKEVLYSPGYFTVRLPAGQSVSFVASVEPWENLTARSRDVFDAERARLRKIISRAPSMDGWAAHLTQAADQFLVLPRGRAGEEAAQQASGEWARSIIAGYPWFTDWGRDTMISLEGLTLSTGRPEEARAILKTYAKYVQDGLLPNHFPEGRNEAVYYTMDATLWYFHALSRYLAATGDEETLREIFPTLQDILERHQKGTRFGIHMDPADGLITSTEPGPPLTWMDAFLDGWAVTPRRGKPVEIQALWYNALCLMADWTEKLDAGPAAPLTALAEKVKASFNRLFWNNGWLYDLVDGDEVEQMRFRPNQIFSFSLPHPILDPSRWEPVLEAVRGRLLTPVGLRTLDPQDSHYQPRYEGPRRQRDGAYHQGLVWPWLLGPFFDAWNRLHPGHAEARNLIQGFSAQLTTGALGTLAEIFDAEPPFRPRGCMAQAWSVAEILRTYMETLKDNAPDKKSP